MNARKMMSIKDILVSVGRKIRHLITICIRLMVSVIVQCMPVKRNTIIFVSYPDFSDNAWSIYKYLKENRPDLSLFWVANNQDKPEEVDDKEILTVNTLDYFRYVWIVSRAGYIMTTHGGASHRLNHHKQISVFLSHGGCAIKAEKHNRRTHVDSRKFYDFALCRGYGSVIPTSKWLCCDPKLLLPLGMARDDIFCKNIGPGNMNPFYNGHSKKLIVWMPTFRKSIRPDLSENNSANSTGLPLMEYDEDVYALDHFLESVGIQLLIKIHPLQENTTIFQKHFENITFVTNIDFKNIRKQTYEIIGYSDALLTDYSSVSFDYLITDKPIGYILDDYEIYEEERGFTFENPKEIMAGHHIYDIDQLKGYIVDVLNSKDDYKEKRQVMRNKFVGDHPEETCKRILEYFKI